MPIVRRSVSNHVGAARRIAARAQNDRFGKVDSSGSGLSPSNCCLPNSRIRSLFGRWKVSVSDISIRPYEAQDEEAVVKLWEICFPDDPPWNEPCDVIHRKMVVQPELLFVALVGDQVVGTVLAGYDGFRGWVNKVATHPSQQRKGIASQLMQTAEKALADMGCAKLNLQVRAGNASVVEFYQRAGYAIEDRVSMGKRLE